MGVMHEIDNAYSIRSTWIVYRHSKHWILDLSLTDLLLISFFPIWMCHFDSVVSLGAEPDNQAFD